MLCCLIWSNSALAIVGGVATSTGQWPFMVGLVAHNSTGNLARPSCGGALIASKWVLTVAHCVNGVSASTFDVALGLSDLNNRSATEVIGVKRVIVHPLYNALAIDYDLALLELNSASSQTVVPIYRRCNGGESQASSFSATLGWGLGDNAEGELYIPNTLRKITLPIASYSQCADFLDATNTITPRMI
jgi:secreted trypsin-like serine protease